MTELGKLLMLFGSILIIAGFLVILFPKIPFIGKLPGDILIRRDGFTFYFPIATSIIISLILTFLLNIFLRR